jgi:hypothetical protein
MTQDLEILRDRRMDITFSSNVPRVFIGVDPGTNSFSQTAIVSVVPYSYNGRTVQVVCPSFFIHIYSMFPHVFNPTYIIIRHGISVLAILRDPMHLQERFGLLMKVPTRLQEQAGASQGRGLPPGTWAAQKQAPHASVKEKQSQNQGPEKHPEPVHLGWVGGEAHVLIQEL